MTDNQSGVTGCGWELHDGPCMKDAVGKIQKGAEMFDGCAFHLGTARSYDMTAVPLSKWLAAHDAEVKAEALREAANKYQEFGCTGNLFLSCGPERIPWGTIAKDLHWRADDLVNGKRED